MRLLLHNPKAMVVLLGLIALLGAMSCDENNKLPPPNAVLPNSAQLTNALLNGKYVSERAVVQARRLRAREGQDIYATARQANNVAISQMRQALVPSGRPLSSNDIYFLLKDADNKREAFLKWCNGEYDAEHGDGSWATSMGNPETVLIDLASLHTDWVQIQEASDKQQRDVILQELEKCEWESWNEVRAQ